MQHRSPTSATGPTSTPASWRSARRSRRRRAITYKLLFNDAVAMTGGQPAEGAFTVRGYRRPGRRRGRAAHRHRGRRAARGCRTPRHCPRARRCTPATSWTRCSADCASIDGVSVLIYDQVCATEKRRRRKRGKMAEPTRIGASSTRRSARTAATAPCSPAASRSSRCETALGRKRRINPTAAMSICPA